MPAIAPNLSRPRDLLEPEEEEGGSGELSGGGSLMMAADETMDSLEGSVEIVEELNGLVFFLQTKGTTRFRTIRDSNLSISSNLGESTMAFTKV